MAVVEEYEPNVPCVCTQIGGSLWILCLTGDSGFCWV